MELSHSFNASLRVNTGWNTGDHSPSLPPASVVPSPTIPTGHDVPFLHVSTSPTRTSFEKPPSSPRRDTSLKNISRGNESKKLLAHVLDQIKDRHMPPSVREALSSTAENVNEKKSGSFIGRAVNRKHSRKEGKAAVYADDESEDEDEGVFSTDSTLDLMTRLRDLLLISAKQGWELFDDDSSQDAYMHRTSSGGRFSSPFRRSLQPGGKRSRSPSPDPRARRSTPTGLLTQCILAISSVISEDCRFQIASPSPSRPPYALQAITLEVAQFLLHTYCQTSEVVSQLVFAVIPAFSTFPREMHARLLAFFEECVARNALEELGSIQGIRDVAYSQGLPQQIEEKNDPIVSIRVDEAFDDPQTPKISKWTPWTRISSQPKSLRSTNSPFQSSIVYNYASFFSPLLAAILENIDFVRNRNEVLQRLYRLLDAIITLKFDAHLDVLEIIAYHTPVARRGATCLLTTFWPKAVGHVVVSKSPVLRKFLDLQAGTKLPPHETSHHVHQFVPWFFLDLGQSTLDKPECDACIKPIQGFGLFCPFCVCSVHLDCYHYPDGNVNVDYASNANSSVNRVAMYRLSPILDRRTIAGGGTVQTHNHNFRLVNLFTLSICHLCLKPLWGIHTQGLQCTACLCFAHSACVATSRVPLCGSVQTDSGCIIVSPSSLIESCIEFYGDLFTLNEQDVKDGGYEDASIIYSSLSTQMQIIKNGLELGSIVLSEHNSSSSQIQELPPFQLHDLLSWSEHYLSSETLPVSPAISEYLEENHVFRRNLNMMFEWSNLVYIASAIKTDYNARNIPEPTSEMLSVSTPHAEGALEPEESNNPFIVVSLAHMRDVLGYEFNIHSDAAAKLLLSHMHHVGLFDRVDLEPKLFVKTEDQNMYCSFPLPLGLDESPDVETLFASVEACLSDLDLSVNEAGFLLLCRRLWPSGMASEYALTRLTRAIVSWVLSEDKDLAIILRDYLAKQRALPGVRSASEPLPWPPMQNSRPAASGSVNNGGDYVASRKALLNRYAVPWLLALHHQNTEEYCNLLYDICAELTDEAIDLPTDLFDEDISHDVKAHAARYHDKVLRSLTRLFHNSIAFTVSEKLFVRWLSSLSTSGIINQPIPSLLRLFQREHQDHRYSITDKPLPFSEGSEFDPWHHILANSESFDGLSRSICWLSVVVSSGVDVSVATYFHFAHMVESFKLSLSSSLIFVTAMFQSVWLRHAGRQQMQKIITDLHFHLGSEIIQSLKDSKTCHETTLLIRLSLATCLLLYGCDREKLKSTGLVTENDIEHLPHRRILGRESQLQDPIVVDTVLMNVLASYVAAGVEEVTCLIAKFLDVFITDSPTLESHEIDNFILRNGEMMAQCAFNFYDIQRHDISSLRTSFLLRVAVVDTQPIHGLLEEWFRPDGDWKARLSALVRLFRIIMDVTSPAFNVEGRQWRSSITEVFYHYFSTLWTDEKEELRLAADTFSSNLLPAHLDQISLCWNEFLVKSPIVDRVRLISFLIQLRPHFPTWQMVSWESIIEIIAQDQYDQDSGNADGPLSAHLSMYGLSSKDDDSATEENTSNDDEMISLRVSIILLSMDMIADGIRIDYNDLLRIKQHTAQVLGFGDVHLTPALNGHSFFVEFGGLRSIPKMAYPCISHLFILLDAHHPLTITDAEIQGFVQNRAWPLLVGSPFVDILLQLFGSNLQELPGLTLKTLLESLGVVIYKHNIEGIYLRHLQGLLKTAISRVQEIMLKDIDYECRQVALSVVQSYIKKSQGSLRSFVNFAVEQVAKLVVSQSYFSQDPLVTQAKAFIESILTTYTNNGIFLGLIRRKQDREIFVVIKQVMDANAKESGSQYLRDAILYDTCKRASETDLQGFQDMLNNLQTFVEVVHHQDYSAETMSFVGQSLTSITRRMSEWDPTLVNPAPLLLIASLLIQHNKAQSRDFLPYTDTVLRATLTRMLVDRATLSRLVQVTATLFRKGPVIPGEVSNNFIHVIFEILNEGLRLKARTLPGTLNSMLETVMFTTINGSTTPALSYPDLFIGLALPGIHFLYNHSWADHRTDNDFQASLTTAKMLLRVSKQDRQIFTKFVDSSIEKIGRQNYSVRAWNILLLAVLQDSSAESINMIFPYLSTFSLVHHAALRPHITRPGVQIPEAAIADVNHAYIAIKAWLILAQVKASRDGSGDVDFLIVWNELYTVFENLVQYFEAEIRAGLPPSLASLTWSTVADLFLFLRHLPSLVALHASSQLNLLERLKPLAKGEAHTGKLAKTIRLLSEKPSDISFEAMSNQVAKDIIATEKLRTLEVLNREVASERRIKAQISSDSNRH